MLTISFFLVNLMTWSTLAVIIGKSLFRKGFGTAPGLLVGCSIGACFNMGFALFFTGAYVQGMAQLLGSLLSDGEVALLGSTYAMAYVAGIVYVRARARVALHCVGDARVSLALCALCPC